MTVAASLRLAPRSSQYITRQRSKQKTISQPITYYYHEYQHLQRWSSRFVWYSEFTDVELTLDTAKAPISTRIESHIPGTQAHRERKLVEHEQDASMRYGSTNQPSTTSAVAPGMNTAPQTGAYGQGTTIGGTHTHTHGATMSDRTNELHGHGPHTTGGAAKPHMGDKVMGTYCASCAKD